MYKKIHSCWDRLGVGVKPLLIPGHTDIGVGGFSSNSQKLKLQLSQMSGRS